MQQSQRFAYSYIRMSTDKQNKGDSLRRQLVWSESFSQRHNLALQDVTAFTDIGVSAWKGLNRSKGRLGAFIDLVNEGTIPSNSYLLVEKPFAIRVDNGPEYVSGKLMEWAANQGIALSHIQPGKSQQNAYVERYNRTVRNEWLDQYIIESIEEAQEFATQWLWTYNNERPNMGIGGVTPAQKLKMAA